MPSLENINLNVSRLFIFQENMISVTFQLAFSLHLLRYMATAKKGEVHGIQRNVKLMLMMTYNIWTYQLFILHLINSCIASK